MFHPTVIAARERDLHDQFRAALPGGRLVRRPHEDCWGMRDQLVDAVNAKGQAMRPLTPEESAFITCERLLATIDFQYWAERYAIIAKESQDAESLFPLWASQTLLLNRIAALERDRYDHAHPDGILVNVLKARQLGVSTLTEVICAHRVTTQTSVRGLVAADVQEQSRYLLSMAELVIERLPWWLKPALRAHQTGDLLHFETDSQLRTAWGKSSRGGLQADSKVKGNIGRGKTYSLVHISEFSTWERPEQIRDGLMPGVPTRPRTFFVRESTAKGRHDPWHEEWTAADKGMGRFTNVFIPWYIEPDKYWLPAPGGWAPVETTAAHVALVERTSPLYLNGTTIRLSRDQAYWYERTRALFEETDELNRFYEEYPATPEEGFQFAGRSVFPPSVLARLQRQERTPEVLAYIRPMREIAQLRAFEAEQAKKAAAE